MNPYYEREGVTIYHGGCMRTLAGLADTRFSTIITDPPYGLSFMGKAWDHGVPGEMFWKRFAMLCHPGAMLLSFGGTRTWHRLAVAIEDAGWEIRDTLMWVYGSGFPKSHNVGGSIDRKQTGKPRGHAIATAGTIQVSTGKQLPPGEHLPRYRGKTADSRVWDGHGTALKPAWEPIILAMNPLDSTFANNALKHGVAGINVDGGRIGTEIRHNPEAGFVRRGRTDEEVFGAVDKNKPDNPPHAVTGRWPANLIHDGSEEVLAGFPQTGGGKASAGKARSRLSSWHEKDGRKTVSALESVANAPDNYGDSGSAARFFYTAKASRSERNAGCEDLYWRRDKAVLTQVTKEEWEDLPKSKRAVGNVHPTVKPLSLMEYLCKLTMMPTDADLVLDPFMGSGSTLIACIRTSRAAVGIDSDEAACEIAAKRVDAELDKEREV